MDGPKPAISEYEKQRQERIAENERLLRSLALDAASVGLAARALPSVTTKAAAAAPKRPSASARAKRAASLSSSELSQNLTRRVSKRLRGLPAAGDEGKENSRNGGDGNATPAAEQKPVIAPTTILPEMQLEGWKGGFLDGGEEIKDGSEMVPSNNRDVEKLREKMGQMALWGDINPNQIEMTPERIYSLEFHPTRTKPLIFAGDKVGNFGLLDASQSIDDDKGDDDDNGSDDDSKEVEITRERLHSRSITAFQVCPSNPNTLYSASYDGTIRRLDLAKGMSIEAYAPYADTKMAKAWEFIGISGLQIPKSEPNLLHFTTLGGQFGIHDIRVASKTFSSDGPKSEVLVQLLEKKIGGFSLHPRRPHLVATASLDRTFRIWDLRKMVSPEENDGDGDKAGGDGGDDDVNSQVPSLLGTHISRLSVSHAAFSNCGHVATTSYDDTIKVYDMSETCGSKRWKAGQGLTKKQLQPQTVIGHNNQTGRWVSILKPHWQPEPADDLGSRFCVGNMKRWVDVYSVKGELVGQLGGSDTVNLTAVPAVTAFHHDRDWLVGGTARGKLCLWMK